MKVCLLYLSVLSLLQLYSRYYGISADKIMWLPSTGNLATIIDICEYELFNEGIRKLPIVIVKQSLSNKPESLNIKSNIDINLNGNGNLNSQSLNVDNKQRDLSGLEFSDPPVMQALPKFRTFKSDYEDQPMHNVNIAIIKNPSKDFKWQPQMGFPFNKNKRQDRFSPALGFMHNPTRRSTDHVMMVKKKNKQDKVFGSIWGGPIFVNVGRKHDGNINNVLLENRTPHGSSFDNKRKYWNIATCVNRKLVEAYI